MLKPENRMPPTFQFPWLWLAIAVLLATPAAADWLVTLEGQLIETEGSWTIDGETLTYSDLEGVEHSLPLDEVDLEGSEETTAFKEGRPYLPKPEIPEPQAAASGPVAAAEDDDRPDIILYQTRWCGYCRKARQLLKQLDADFVAKDIERDHAAAREYREKGQGYRGVPLFDFDGEIVRGYSDRLIRRKVRELQQKQTD